MEWWQKEAPHLSLISFQELTKIEYMNAVKVQYTLFKHKVSFFYIFIFSIE